MFIKIVYRIKVFFSRFILEWFKIKISWIKRLQSISTHAGNFAGSIIGLFIAAFLYLPSSQEALIKFDGIHNIFLAVGGMIGTMLALVISLSIIPIQRAAEVFTPTIIRLYKNDQVTLRIFILLTFFCVAFFIIGIKGVFFFEISKIFPFGILAVACSLDLIRWYQRHVTELLNPSFAITRLSNETIRFIQGLQKNISRLARIQFNMLPDDKKKESPQERVETALYTFYRYHSTLINNWSGEIAEIVHKAVSRGETFTAKAGINSLVAISNVYLNARKKNILFFPSLDAFLMTTDNDAKYVINPIYENLQDINKTAILNRNETISIQVIRAFESMSIFTVNLVLPQIRGNKDPLTFTPIYYLRECIKATQLAKMFEPAFQSSKSLLRIGGSAPKNADFTSVYGSLIEGWQLIAESFYVTDQDNLVSNVLSDMIQCIFSLLKHGHFQFHYIFRDMLEKLERIVFLALAKEKLKGKSFQGLTLSPYDLTNQNSLGYLIQYSATQIKKEDKKTWIDPYSYFKKINEDLYRHFRDLAENLDFGDSFLLWHIAETIKHISKVYLGLIEKPITDIDSHIKGLTSQVSWYLSFFWVAFSKTTKFNFQHADQACDIMAWVGLAFYAKGYPDVTKKCISNISSIIQSYAKFQSSYEEYHMADLFIHLWEIRLYVESQNNNDFLEDIDKRMNDKPKSISEEQWKEVVAAIELRKGQLNESLNEFNDYPFMENAESFLKKLLKGDVDSKTI